MRFRVSAPHQLQIQAEFPHGSCAETRLALRFFANIHALSGGYFPLSFRDTRSPIQKTPENNTEVTRMARIAGVDLPREKRVEIGLTYIYGIGLATSK